MIAKWRSSFYFRLVLSYTILAIVLIGITGGYLLSNANRMVTDEVTKDARFGLLNIRDVVETNFLRVYEDAFFNKVLSTLSPTSAESINYLLDHPAQGNMFRLVSFINDLGVITDMTEGIDGITVYFRKGQYAVDERRYYESPDNSADAAFIRSLDSVPARHWFKRDTPEGKQVMTYVYTLPYNAVPAQATGFLYLDISIAQMDKMIGNVIYFPQSNFYLYDEKGQMLLGGGDASQAERDDVRSLIESSANNHESGDISTRLGNNVISVLRGGSKNGWTYVIVRPMESFLLSADKMKRKVWTVSLIALIGGIIASFLMSRHFHMPLKRLLYSIRNLYNGPTPNVRGTEYATIDHMLMFIDNSMLKMKDQVRIKQISGLITGQHTVAGFDELPGIPLECRYVVAYIVTEPEDSDRVAQMIREKSGLTAEIVNLSATELAMLVFIYDKTAESKVIIAQAADMLAPLMSAMPFGAGFGKVVDSVDAVHTSYKEATQAYNYSFIRGKHSIIAYEDIEGARETLLSPDVGYDQFQHKVQAGSVNEVEQWINELTLRLRREPIGVQTIELIFLRLSTVLSQVVLEQKLDDMFPVFSFHILVKQRTMDETFAILKEHAVKIARHIQESRNDTHFEKINLLKSFITEHMADDLSLDELAEKADLSPNYVSTLFGTITGESFTEYLNRIRLEQAAYLLINKPKLSVSEIATSVGYRNSPYFCTKFKVKFGITPMQFRTSEKKREQFAK